MKKPVRKAAPKRRGYADGGKVREKPAIFDQLEATADSMRPTAERSARYEAAHDAISSSIYNEAGPERRAEYRARVEAKGYPPGKTETGRDMELARADYPGFSRGGAVKKTIKPKAKRKAR